MGDAVLIPLRVIIIPAVSIVSEKSNLYVAASLAPAIFLKTCIFKIPVDKA